METKKTKVELIKEYLLQGKGITTSMAKYMFGCNCLSAAIAKIRKELIVLTYNPYDAYSKGLISRDERLEAILDGVQVYAVPVMVINEYLNNAA